MEKFTIRSTYSEVRLYARWTAYAPPGGSGEAKVPARPDDSGNPANAQSAPKAATARNADGDTFTLSIEARAIQVSESISIENRTGGAKPSRAESPGPLSRAEAVARLQEGRLQALLEALDRRHDQGERRHGYPRLADAGDVAARAAEEWERDYAERAGSRREFAAGLREKLERWTAGHTDDRDTGAELRVFRSEVAMRIDARLEDWAAAEDPAGIPPAC